MSTITISTALDYRLSYRVDARSLLLKDCLWYDEPYAASNAISYAQFNSRSHDALIHVFDAAVNVIETYQPAGHAGWQKNLEEARLDSLLVYGSGAPGRKFFEDIAATPASPSPSNWVGAEPGTQSSSSAGSANQKTT